MRVPHPARVSGGAENKCAEECLPVRTPQAAAQEDVHRHETQPDMGEQEEMISRSQRQEPAEQAKWIQNAGIDVLKQWSAAAE